jgi:hypothetical protein
MCEVDVLNPAQGELAENLGLSPNLVSGSVFATDFTYEQRDDLRKLRANPDEQEYALLRIWREAGATELLAQHMAERALQKIDRALATKSEAIPSRYFMLNAGQRSDDVQQEHVNWLIERNFRQGLGVVATLHTGTLVRLPDAHQGMSSTELYDFKATFLSPRLGSLTIANTIHWAADDRENPNEPKHVAFASLYEFSISD